MFPDTPGEIEPQSPQDAGTIEAVGSLVVDDLVVVDSLTNGEQTEHEVFWMRRHEVARHLGLPLSTTKRLTDQLRDEVPDLFRNGNNEHDEHILYCRSDILAVIAERKPANSDWVHDEQLAKELDLPVRSIRSLHRTLREEDEFQDGFKIFKSEEDDVAREHFTRRVANKIRDIIIGRRERRNTRETNDRLKREFNVFAEDVKNGESFEAQEFKTLISLFGAESGFDVLFQYRPEFKGKVLMPQVKSFLAEYLGDFITKQGELDLTNLNHALPYLSNKDLQRALTGVIKRDCLKKFHQAIKEDPNQDEFDIIATYLDTIRQSVEGLDSEQLDEVIAEIDAYYLSLFELEIPPQIVSDDLTIGRPFPDLNQRINIKEIEDGHRMLIADEPGMGKSASAILAKEKIGAKCALIITPSQVMNQQVWQTYLSDRVGDDGEQLGYFKAGQAPRVLIVGSIEDLQRATADDYDYILMSQEGLTEGYKNALMDIGFDMLIVDEAHRFKNIREGVWAKRLLELATVVEDDDKYMVMLTATPAPNKVFDIALSLRLLYPKKFKQYSNTDLVHKIINGDILDIRSLILPKMQIKRLADTLEMPPLDEQTIMLDLSEPEKAVYEILLDEWEMDASEKIRFLRQILLNPALLDATPSLPFTKLETLRRDLQEAFKTKDKVLLFVNDYVQGIIAGPENILGDLDLPPEVEISTIYQDISKANRFHIQDRFQNGTDKMLLIVSGQTVSVGVDLSASEEIGFINEPWTRTQKHQELGRGWRPGRKGELVSKTYITRGTIEEGIHLYTEAKHRAIEKLLYGVPLTDLEKELVERSEESDEDSLAVNIGLSAHYFSARDRMNQIFGSVKEIGEEGLRRYLLKNNNGAEYARVYRQLSGRSYQANASRLGATLISRFSKETHKEEPVILDLGSGPEMLRRHIDDKLADRVVSLDINPEHFVDGEGNRVGGKLTKLPVQSDSVDYINMSLVLHYTKWEPSRGNYERLQSFYEMSRVLKMKGRAVITMMYSLDFNDEPAFERMMGVLGFRVIKGYSDQVQAGDNFRARLVTLEKVGEAPADFEDVLAEVEKLPKLGLRMVHRDVSLRDTRQMVTSYTMKKNRVALPATFNSHDQLVWDEEQRVLADMSALRDAYGKIENIPDNEILARNYARIKSGKKYILFTHLSTGDGAIILRNKSA